MLRSVLEASSDLVVVGHSHVLLSLLVDGKYVLKVRVSFEEVRVLRQLSLDEVPL